MHLQTTKGFAMQIGAAEGGGRGKGGLGAAEYEAAGALACVTGTHAWRLRIGESHARTPYDAATREVPTSSSSTNTQQTLTNVPRSRTVY